MHTVFLHCGAPKTGTSYLQVLFAKHVDDLLANGIKYPLNSFVDGAKDGKITSGNGVEMANYLRPNLPHRIADKAAFAQTFDRLLAEADGGDLLFSSEFLVFPDNDRTADLVALIAKHGYSARVIYMVRDYANVARSAYSQNVKRQGEKARFQEFIETWDPHYTHHINLMEKAFGAEALWIHNYEEHRDDLARLVFHDLLKCAVPVAETGIINRSLNDKELELLRQFNKNAARKDSATSSFASDALMKIAGGLGGEYVPSRAEYDILHRRFAGSIEHINARVTGRPIKISNGFTEERAEVELDDFERFTMAILHKLVATRKN